MRSLSTSLSRLLFHSLVRDRLTLPSVLDDAVFIKLIPSWQESLENDFTASSYLLPLPRQTKSPISRSLAPRAYGEGNILQYLIGSHEAGATAHHGNGGDQGLFHDRGTDAVLGAYAVQASFLLEEERFIQRCICEYWFDRRRSSSNGS